MQKNTEKEAKTKTHTRNTLRNNIIYFVTKNRTLFK